IQNPAEKSHRRQNQERQRKRPPETAAEFFPAHARENLRGRSFPPDEQGDKPNQQREGIAAGVEFMNRGKHPARAIKIRTKPDPKEHDSRHFAGEFYAAPALKSIKLVRTI